MSKFRDAESDEELREILDGMTREEAANELALFMKEHDEFRRKMHEEMEKQNNDIKQTLKEIDDALNGLTEES